MRHIRAYKLAATYKIVMYFLVNIHINNYIR
jgi:hypothetical protein